MGNPVIGTSDLGLNFFISSAKIRYSVSETFFNLQFKYSILNLKFVSFSFAARVWRSSTCLVCFVLYPPILFVNKTDVQSREKVNIARLSYYGGSIIWFSSLSLSLCSSILYMFEVYTAAPAIPHYTSIYYWMVHGVRWFEYFPNKKLG